MLRYTSFVDLDAAQLAVVESIYHEAFPPHRRAPFARLADAGDAVTVVGLDEGTPVSFAKLSRLTSIDWLFLKYHAVHQDHRDRGLGTELWRHIRDTADAEGAKGIVLEVADPDQDGVDTAERLERDRRIAFYLSRGAGRLAHGGYVAPFVDGSGSEPMWLLAAVDGGLGLVPDELVRTVYVEGYGLDESHPLVRSLDEDDG
ncbi:MAG: GNAT family N-acetyltransferase [Nocardioidaceae bacterium]